MQVKGNLVKIRNGPAAVTGDERHTTTDDKREGVVSKQIRESENLPETLIVILARA